MEGSVYYTIGYSSTYIDVTKLSIDTLLASGYKGDILVLCDNSLMDQCVDKLGPTIRYIAMPDSKSPQEASMHKLCIFDSPLAYDYDVLLFIDSDIVVHTDVTQILTQVVQKDILYVGTESTKFDDHKYIYWSLNNYTSEQLENFEKESIFVFNAGCFAFVCNDIMKKHFQNVLSLIDNYVGEFFYEQSFMNVYFNLANNTDRTLLGRDKYVITNDTEINHTGKLIHFTGNPGNGMNKITMMSSYINTHFTI